MSNRKTLHALVLESKTIPLFAPIILGSRPKDNDFLVRGFTHLLNISEMKSFPQVGVETKIFEMGPRHSNNNNNNHNHNHNRNHNKNNNHNHNKNNNHTTPQHTTTTTTTTTTSTTQSWFMVVYPTTIWSQNWAKPQLKFNVKAILDTNLSIQWRLREVPKFDHEGDRTPGIWVGVEGQCFWKKNSFINSWFNKKTRSVCICWHGIFLHFALLC